MARHLSVAGEIKRKGKQEGCAAYYVGNDIAVYKTLTVPINIITVRRRYLTGLSIWHKNQLYITGRHCISGNYHH